MSGSPIVFETRSVDEARHFYSSRYMPIRLEPRPRARFGWRASQVAAGPITVLTSRISSAIDVRTDAVEGSYNIGRSLEGRVAMHHRGELLRLQAGDAHVTSPTLPARYHFDEGTLGVQVAIPRALVEGAFQALTGDPPRGGAIHLDPRVEPRRAASVLRLVDFLIHEAQQQPTALGSALAAGSLAEALVHALLACQPHDHAGPLQAPPPRPGHRAVRRVEEFIAANAARPISASDLVAVTGVSLRALELAFRRDRGMSPMAFVRERRMAAARARLLASPSLSITEVALECGFVHLGRFSKRYGERFGETPSETKRRALARRDG